MVQLHSSAPLPMTPRTLAAASRSLGRLQSAATCLPAATQLASGSPSLFRLSCGASVARSAAGGFSLPGKTPSSLRRLLVSTPLKQVPQQSSFGQAPRRSATRTLSIMAAQTPSGSQATEFEAGEEKARQDTQPGKEHKMAVKPETIPQHYKAAGKLEGKKALITGGDSGIGRAVAALFAMEGADVGITYVAGHEDKDAEETLALLAEVSGGQRKATKYAADLGYDDQCKQVADAFLRDHGRIDILVNHAGEQHAVQKFEDLSPETVERTFRTNVYSQFFLTRHLLPSMPEGGAIINTASVNAYKGNKQLIDYTASKGANVAFTRALALNLADRNIRVNGVAPGPIWTPLISATFPEEKVAKFGEETPLGRAGHPSEVAPAYVFLASADASYITGQVIHPNGGMVVNA